MAPFAAEEEVVSVAVEVVVAEIDTAAAAVSNVAGTVDVFAEKKKNVFDVVDALVVDIDAADTVAAEEEQPSHPFQMGHSFCLYLDVAMVLCKVSLTFDCA